MDLHNNSLGRITWASLGGINTVLSPENIANELCSRLANGQMIVFINPEDDQSDLVPSNNCKCD